MCYEQKNLLSDDYLIAQSLIDDIKYIESLLPAYSTLCNKQRFGKEEDTDFGKINIHSSKVFCYWAYFSFTSSDIPVIVKFKKYNVTVDIRKSSLIDPYHPRWIIYDHRSLYSINHIKTILEFCPILPYCMLRVREFITSELKMK